jgi:hypothetical protein
MPTAPSTATLRADGVAFELLATHGYEDSAEHEVQGRLHFQQGVLIPEVDKIGKQLMYPTFSVELN